MIKNKKIKLFRYKDIDSFGKEDREEIKRIVRDTDELCKEYFKTFERLHRHDGQEIVISKGDFNIKIPMNKEMKTECGFFRVGYSYRMLSNQKSIGSVIQHRYNNIEIGFFDERGLYYEKEMRWDCIYLR